MSQDPTQPVPPPLDPTQAVPPPIEPALQEEDLTPPPPPIIPSELPYAQLQESRRSRHTRTTIIVLSILAVLVLGGAGLAYVLTQPRPPSSHTANEYHEWLQQEQNQHSQIVYAAFAEQDWQTLSVSTIDTQQQDASVLCSQIAKDYVTRFATSIAVHMNDNNNTCRPFVCTDAPGT